MTQVTSVSNRWISGTSQKPAKRWLSRSPRKRTVDRTIKWRLKRGPNTLAAEYWFEVTLHNTTTGTISELGIGLYDAPNSGVGAQFARFDLPDGFNSSGGTFTRTSDSFAIFSGLGLVPGATQTLGFSLDFLADLVGPTFENNAPVFIQFTAIPEPHAVLLGGQCLMAFVVGVLLQRRRQAKPASLGLARPGTQFLGHAFRIATAHHLAIGQD